MISPRSLIIRKKTHTHITIKKKDVITSIKMIEHGMQLKDALFVVPI
jgi:hypothetical protein